MGLFNKTPKEFQNKDWADGFKSGYIAAINERPILSDAILKLIEEKAVEEAIRRVKDG